MKRVMKRIYCFLIALIVGCIPTISVQAASENARTEAEAIQARISGISSDISEAVPMAYTDIQDLVDYQIETYIATEYEAEGRELRAGEENSWIPLADLEGNLFAYLVPLVDREEGEVGYITMGAIEDGFSKYMLAWDTTLLKSYRDLLDSTPEAVPVFFMPMQYGYFVENETGKQIFLMCEWNEEPTDITASVAENAERFAAGYQAVRSAENAARLESSLAKAEQIKMGISVMASVPKEDVRLSCEWQGDNKFVPIYDPNEGRYRYGGDQNWYDDDAKKENGCGPVAGCNVLYYMSTKYSGFSNLYPYTSLTKTKFKSYMNLIYGYVDPGKWGETSLASWADDLIRFAANRGVSLTARYCSDNNTKAVCASHIKSGLNIDRPVGAVNLAAPFGSGATQAWHWVTITKYFQSTSDDRWIAVSSLGERESVDWDAYYANMTSSLLSGGFAYFVT